MVGELSQCHCGGNIGISPTMDGIRGLAAGVVMLRRILMKVFAECSWPERFFGQGSLKAFGFTKCLLNLCVFFAFLIFPLSIPLLSSLLLSSHSFSSSSRFSFSLFFHFSRLLLLKKESLLETGKKEKKRKITMGDRIRLVNTNGKELMHKRCECLSASNAFDHLLQNGMKRHLAIRPASKKNIVTPGRNGYLVRIPDGVISKLPSDCSQKGTKKKN